MGKRKKSSRKPTAPKKKEILATNFTCLFCNHEKSVVVKLDKRNGVGELHCKVCGQNFQSGINYLSAAIDVYSDWIDACEDVKNGTQRARRAPPPPRTEETNDDDRVLYDLDPDRELPELSFTRGESQDAVGEEI
ncbi:MAG: AAA ATPase Elf1 [Peltula sp. TS41687]|nr:MAG: AAA ATPase Elf1 [Peltula sp. TS41687]